MVRSCGMLISIVGLALAVGMGCGDDEPDDGTGGSGGTGGTGATGGAGGAAGGAGGSGGVGGAVACPPVTGSAPTACRNSFTLQVSEFPVDMTIAFDNCPIAGQTFNATVTPTLNFDQEFLQIAAVTLCNLGVDICDGAQFADIQVHVDALTGATCTSQLSELPIAPDTCFSDGAACDILDSTACGDNPAECGFVVLQPPCSAGCPTPVVTGALVAELPPVVLPCTAGAAPGPVGICATGITPLSVAFDDPPVDSWVTVGLFNGNLPVNFACGAATTAPEDDVACTTDADCASFVGSAGEEPFPVSVCDLDAGSATFQECTNVPIAIDPATDCVTFAIDGAGGTGGAGGGTGGAGGGTGGAGGGTGGAGGGTGGAGGGTGGAGGAMM